jgi:hypothetical protein
MSNALAIAAVTATLSSLLQNVNQGTGLSGVSITAKPPDKARDGTGNQINLFLYQVLLNAAWRNMDIPQRVRSGETGIPPLALNLYYMMTSYGDGNDDVLGHRLLGHAMSILYDHPLLGSQEIQAALPGNLNSELQNQIERVRITFQPLSVEEIFRLWTGFQTQYRISVAYEVAVVLIESTRPVKTPLPVVTRGPGDTGVTAQGNLTPPFPTIEAVVLPHPPSALLPDNLSPIDPDRNDLTLKGHDLLPGPDPTKQAGQQIDNTRTKVRFLNPRWLKPVDLSPKTGSTLTGNAVTVALPDDPANWPAGFYTVSLVYSDANGDEVRTSNEVSFSLAPSILLDAPTVTKDANGNISDVTIMLHCSPAVQQTVQRIEQGMEFTALQEQRVTFLFRDREVPFVFPPAPNPPTVPIAFQDLSFDLGVIPTGEYFVRLRVDGVDSLLVDRTVTPPQFDLSQKVVIT